MPHAIAAVAVALAAHFAPAREQGGFAGAELRFVKASQGGDEAEKQAALAALVALGDPAGLALLVTEYGGTAESLREDEEKLAKTSYALDRSRVVLANLELLVKRDPSADKLIAREREEIQKLAGEVDDLKRKVERLTKWRDALSEGLGTLFTRAPDSKRKKTEAEIWQDAREHPDTLVRLGSIDLLGRIGGTGTAAALHDLLVESVAAVKKLEDRRAKTMSDVRKMERRLQEEAAANEGRTQRANQDQYEQIKSEAAAATREIYRLQILIATAARAGGRALARESGKDLEKTLAKLVAALKKHRDRARLDTLALLTAAQSDEARVRVRALFDTETEPIGIATLIDGLAALGDRAIVPALLAKHLAHENWYVRARAAHALATLRSREAIPALIARLPSEEGRVRTDVGQALTSLTGQDFRGNVALWQRWWKENEASFQVPEQPPEKSAEEEARESAGVTFFGISTESQRILFVLDLSGSMDFAMVPKSNPDDDPGKPYDYPEEGESSRLQVAKRDLIKALGGLRDGGVFNLVLYASDVWTWTDDGRLVTMEPKTRAQVVEFVEAADAVGGTNIYGAMERALDVAGAKGGGEWSKPAVDTIYLLTDGRATVGVTTDPDEILAYVRERNRTAGIVIHTIGLSDAHDAVLLRRLAEENGGKYVGR
jgi:HEAT repeat protein